MKTNKSNSPQTKPVFKWMDWNCEGCGIYKMLTKRESDGKILCKKCFKNRSLAMEIKNNKPARVSPDNPQTKPLKDYDWESIRKEVDFLMVEEPDLTKDSAKQIIAKRYRINPLSFDNWFYKKEEEKPAEISLSDKIDEEFKEVEYKHIEFLRELIIKDIKEAVKKLKERIKLEGYKETKDDIDKIIDAIFGRELSK